MVEKTKKKKKVLSQDEVNTKLFDLIEKVQKNQNQILTSIKIVKQRLDALDIKLDKVSNRVGIV